MWNLKQIHIIIQINYLQIKTKIKLLLKTSRRIKELLHSKLRLKINNKS